MGTRGIDVKITIEVSDQKVIVQDDTVYGCGDTIQLIKQALLAIGFQPDTVKEYIDDY